MSSFPLPLKPIATRELNGDVSVFIGGAHKRLPHAAAASLFEQLATALRTPYSEGTALFTAHVLRLHRGTSPGEVGDVDGAELEELALSHGLLEPFEVKASCGDHCVCVQGDRCYRYTPLARSLLASTELGETPAEVTL